MKANKIEYLINTHADGDDSYDICISVGADGVEVSDSQATVALLFNDLPRVVQTLLRIQSHIEAGDV